MAKKHIAGAALAPIPVVGPVLREIIARTDLSSQSKLETRTPELHMEWLRDDVDAMARKLDVLVAALPGLVTQADIHSIFEGARRVSAKTSNPSKRQLLRNAVRAAFNPKLYEQGLTLRVMKVLEDLEYQDIRLLHRIGLDFPENVKWGVLPQGEWSGNPHGSPLAHSMKILTDAGLAAVFGSPPSRHTIVGITFLGRLLLEYVADNPAEEEER